MASNPPGTDRRYWLLSGSTPSGPFTVEQVHAKLAAGEITWETQACPLGSSTWLPLVRTPGLGPTPAPTDIPAAIPVPPTSRQEKPPRSSTQDIPTATSALPDAVTANPRRLPPGLPIQEVLRASLPVAAGGSAMVQPAGPSPGPAPAPQAPNWVGAVVGIVVLALLGWGAYEWLRPLTPREVCDRFDKAKTAKEAFPYCTLNLHPAVEALYRQQTPDSPDDKYEYTQEGDAPANVGGYFVGVRAQFYVPEERRRVQIDGVFHLIKSDGWKIEDMYFFSVDRQPLPEPISIARDYPVLLGQQRDGGQLAQPPRTAVVSSTNTKQAKDWYSNPANQRLAVRGIGSFLAHGGGKAIGVVLLAVLLGLLRFGKVVLAFLTGGSQDRQRSA